MIEVLPTWLNVCHIGLAIMIVVLLGYCALARIHEEATGPILVEARVKTTIAATSRNVVQAIAVAVGDPVREGDLVLRLGNSAGDNLLDRLKAEYRSPVNGVIGDILVRPGQNVGMGDDLFTVVDEHAGLELIALLPGSYAPQIHKGASIVFKLQGYNETRETVNIDDVSQEIVGPQEATRFLGQQSAGSLNVSGPVLIAKSMLLPESFQADGRRFSYRDGMTGEGEVSVHSEPLIIKLVPGLHELLRNPGDLFKVK
jgi:multidrug resistance efflux pump